MCQPPCLRVLEAEMELERARKAAAAEAAASPTAPLRALERRSIAPEEIETDVRAQGSHSARTLLHCGYLCILLTALGALCVWCRCARGLA